MIVEIQVLPRPAGTAENRYAHVEAAIGLIQNSGLTYEVGALGTTIEGAPDQIWALLRAVHEATLESGSDSVISVIKVSQAAGDTGPAIKDLTGKFRQ
ncbi:thiamine-binding protein [Nakamurella silvestris]|nr:thiamine-binding protein [Nakamurella silvestris]